MLKEKPELQDVFNNLKTGFNKPYECIRVDGATDEGPSHKILSFGGPNGLLCKER